MTWQPIETAPKDGSPVLLYYPEGLWVTSEATDWDTVPEPEYAVMRWDQELAARLTGRDALCWRGYYEGTTPHGAPSLWMPIPAPLT